MSVPKTCIHIMMDGHRCGCMALENNRYCYFHARHYSPVRPSDADYELPILEDTRSLLVGLRELMDAYMKGKVPQKGMTTMLYAYQIAMSGVHRPDGMSPHALQQLEAREAALLEAKARAKQKPEKEEKQYPSLEEFLLEPLTDEEKENLDS